MAMAGGVGGGGVDDNDDDDDDDEIVKCDLLQHRSDAVCRHVFVSILKSVHERDAARLPTRDQA